MRFASSLTVIMVVVVRMRVFVMVGMFVVTVIIMFVMIIVIVVFITLMLLAIFVSVLHFNRLRRRVLSGDGNLFHLGRLFNDWRCFGLERSGGIFGRLARYQGKAARGEQEHSSRHIRLQLSFDRARCEAYFAGRDLRYYNIPVN